jgi:hypothetical protein
MVAARHSVVAEGKCRLRRTENEWSRRKRSSRVPTMETCARWRREPARNCGPGIWMTCRWTFHHLAKRERQAISGHRRRRQSGHVRDWHPRRGSLHNAVEGCGSATASNLADGKGRELVERVCSGCHAADRVGASPLTRDEWHQTVQKMAQLGASATDGEFATDRRLSDRALWKEGPESEVDGFERSNPLISGS